MLLKKVILQNFQSHVYTEIDVSPTLTVIVGESDNGKSSIARAIRWVLFNEPRGSDFVRVGASECSVSLIYEDGTVVSRIRNSSGSKNRYVITRNGEEAVFEGFGAAVPDEVKKVTGVDKVKIDEDLSIDMHTSTQLEPPFLLMHNGAVKAKAIGQLTGTHIFDAAHKKAVQDLNRGKEDLKRIKGELDTTEEKLKEYEDLPQLDGVIQSIRNMLNVIAYKKNLVDNLKVLRDRMVENKNKLNQIKDIIKLLSAIDVVENLELKADRAYQILVAAEKLKGTLMEISDKINNSEYVIKETSEIRTISDYMERSEQIFNLYQNIFSISSRIKRNDRDLRIIDNALNDMKDVDMIFDMVNRSINLKEKLDDIKGLYEKLEKLKKELSSANKIVRGTGDITEIQDLLMLAEKKLSIYEQVSDKSKKLAEYSNSLKAVNKNIHDSESDIMRLSNKYENLLRKLRICPVCLSPISDEKAHEIVHDMLGEIASALDM